MWRFYARPDLWHRWAPHVRGARGLGSPEVREGARGVVLLAPSIPIPATITAVSPGRAWSWRVGPVTMRHEVIPRPERSEMTLELSAPRGLEAAIATVYGPLVVVLLANLGRVAARADPGSRRGRGRSA